MHDKNGIWFEAVESSLTNFQEKNVCPDNIYAVEMYEQLK